MSLPEDDRLNLGAPRSPGRFRFDRARCATSYRSGARVTKKEKGSGGWVCGSGDSDAE